MSNNIARNVVVRYLAQEAPRYALLLDAPWGAGKTHFIERTTNCKADETRLYVSLYGVTNADQFDWALVRAVQPWTSGLAGRWGRRVKEFASGLEVLGCSLDLSKIDITELALEGLPDTLIFDDVERCTIPPKVLWGLVNRYVEHGGKKVILVANSAKIEKQDEFLSTREKLVGQVIQIHADVEAAIAASWVSIPSGQGREVLQKHQEAIKETFVEANQQNLRLLLRAMRDAAELIEKIDAELVSFDDPIERLVRTFFALHMAFYSAMISHKDLKNRDDITVFMTMEKTEEPSALRLLADKHPKADVRAYSGAAFPVELACSLFVDGYANREAVNEALRSAHQFASSEGKPDWVRLWGWVSESEEELKEIELRIEKRLRNFEVSDPGELLQIYGAQNFKGSYLDGFCAKEHAKKYRNYIKNLKKSGGLPAKSPSADRRDEEYGFSKRDSMILYGGYSFELDDDGKSLVEFLCSEMDAEFEESLPSLAIDLLDHLQFEPLKFVELLEYSANSPSLWCVPILHYLDVKDVSSEILGHFREKRWIAEQLLDTIGHRQKQHRTSLKLEHDWIESLKENLEDMAKAVSPICAAQFRLTIERKMSAE